MNGKNQAKYKKHVVALTKQELTLYVSPKIHTAIAKIMEMDTFSGIQHIQLLEAVYEQGKKDGRREIIEGIATITDKAKYLAPGQPRKKRAKKAK